MFQKGQPMRLIKFTAIISLLWGSHAALADPIFYEVENIDGDTWQYTYTVGNDTGDIIDWFTIFFDPALYVFDLITDPDGFEEVDPDISASPDGWDVFVAPPDFFFPGSADNSEGFFDACGFMDDFLPCFGDAFVDTGELIGGFTIIFDWLGGPGTTPGAQPFTLFGDDLPANPTLFTQLRPTESVPEPGSFALFGGGLLLLIGMRRRSRSQSLVMNDAASMH